MVLKTDFTRSQENAQDNLNANFTEIEGYIEDTGWIDIPASNGFAWALSQPGQYRKIGKAIYLRGQLGRTDKTGVFATIPYGPYKQTGYKCTQGSSVASEQATIYLNTNGDMQLIAVTSTTKDVFLNEIWFLVD